MWLRRAGVLLGIGVQREHRRVEHRACHHVVPGMRRLFGPGGAPPPAGRARRVVDAARAVVRGGTADVRARVCADVLARACAGVHVPKHGCAYERRDIDFMYVYFSYIYIYIYIYICMRYTYTHRYICTFVTEGYWRACGCTAIHAHVSVIAHADDAAVAITCVRGYVRRYI